MAYQARPPPRRGPPPDRRVPHVPGAAAGSRPVGYEDASSGQYRGRGGRGVYDGPQGSRLPAPGHRPGPPPSHSQSHPPPGPGPGRLQSKPPPVRQYTTNQVAPDKPTAGKSSSFDSPFPAFPPRQRGNSFDLGVEKKMGALDLNQGPPLRDESPVRRPHTSNSNRPPPSTHHSEPLPPFNPARVPGDGPPSRRNAGSPLSVETHHAASPPAQQSPRIMPPLRSATMPVNMSPGAPKPLYPGQRTWQDLSPPPLSPALRSDSLSVSSRPGTAPGVKPEVVHPKTVEPEAQVADKVDGPDDELSDLTEDLLNEYYSDPVDPAEPDMPNFGAMAHDNAAGTPHEESLIPFDKPKQQDGPPKTTYAAYKPTSGQTSLGYSTDGYAADGYGRVMTPVQQGGYGGRGGYPPTHQQYHQYGPENGDARAQYDDDGRQTYSSAGHDMQYDNQYSGYQSPDSLPHHPPPAPFRPGLDQGPKPAPVRHYTAPQPTSTPQLGQYGADDRRASQPITIGELHTFQQAARSNPSDHARQLVLVKKLVEASIHLIDDGGRADAKSKAKNRERYVNDAYKAAKKLVSAGYPPAMFYMADCYGSGQLGLEVNPKEAFSLYQSAAKMGHAESAYRLAVCCEMGQEGGGGTRRDPMKAVQWYRRAASLGDPPAMYKMGMILLKGLLGQPRNPREALSWLKRAAERADAENPHALHELALLYENPQGNDAIIRDENYARDLLHQAGELGYKFSQHRLGAAYEYGLVGCPVDPRQSIYWYTQAAAQGEHQSELSLSGWYLTGSEGILQQSDTEAYLWARKAAMAGLAKAEYAMGYFTEVGIGVPANLEDAKRWYWKASSQNFLKARERLEDLRRGGAKMQKTRVSRSAVNKNEGDCIVM